MTLVTDQPNSSDNTQNIDMTNYTLTQEDIAKCFIYYKLPNYLSEHLICEKDEFTVKLQTLEKTRFILNLNNNHWVLLHVQKTQKELLVLYFDPYANTFPSDYHSILSAFAAKNSLQLNIIANLNSQQADAVNCGLYVFFIAKWLHDEMFSCINNYKFIMATIDQLDFTRYMPKLRARYIQDIHKINPTVTSTEVSLAEAHAYRTHQDKKRITKQLKLEQEKFANISQSLDPSEKEELKAQIEFLKQQRNRLRNNYLTESKAVNKLAQDLKLLNSYTKSKK